MQLIEMYYFITNKPYFMVYVLSNGRRIKKFVQLAAGTKKGEDSFLICKSLKASWFKPEAPIIDGLKFLTLVDIANAIPLRFERETIIETGEYINKETTKAKITVNKTKIKKENDGKPLRTVEIQFPPSLLYQKVEAHFVKEIQSVPPSKWDELKWVFIAGILVVGFIAWQIISSGGIGL